MIDAFVFAIKCGGSAKKADPRITVPATVEPKPTPNLKKSTSLSTSLNRNNSYYSASPTIKVRKDCKKCDDIVRNELIENITPDNAIICKHNSASNLSTYNPGLIIVEKETAMDAQAALYNSHVIPHSHIHISHQQAKKLYYEQNVKKSPKKKHESLNQNPDYIQMHKMSRSNELKPYLQNQQDQVPTKRKTYHSELKSVDPQEIPIKMDNYSNSASYDDYDKQLYLDRYPSRSDILKNPTEEIVSYESIQSKLDLRTFQNAKQYQNIHYL